MNDDVITENYESAKKSAALTASDSKVGLGTGSTAYYVAEHISHLLSEGKVKNLILYPTSVDAFRVAREMNLTVGDINDVDSVDITFDGCDECDESLTLLKGGGGCHVQEKVVATISKFYVVIGDSRKLVKKLGETWKKGVSVEVLKFCVDLVSRRVVKALGGTATVRYAGRAKCGPVVTDNGNYIIDWVFPYGIHFYKTWQDVEYELLNIPGVVGTGLFIGIAHVGVFADPLGMTWDLKRPGL